MMPAYPTREEFKVLQNEVEGEKLVTRHILEQTRRNSDDLATLIRKVDGLESRVESLESKVGALDAKLIELIHSLPTIIAEALRKDRSEAARKRNRIRVTRTSLT
jgi:seryl-tRNA synthetase